MKRRTFFQAVGAAATVSLVRLEPLVDRERLLAAFAGPSWRSRHWDMTAPWSDDGRTWATDGIGGVAAEWIAGIPTGEERRRPPLADALKSAQRLGGWQRLSGMPEFTLSSKTGSCPACGNRRVSMGEHYPPEEWLLSRKAADLDYDIEDNTIRDPSCQTCIGRQYAGHDLAEIEGEAMDGFLLRRVVALPGCEVAKATNKHGSTGLLFRADGFYGMQMGVNVDG